MTWLESFWEFENFYYYYYYTNFLFNVSLFLIYSLDDEQRRIGVTVIVFYTEFLWLYIYEQWIFSTGRSNAVKIDTMLV